jgi:hypothetical protein
MAEYRNIFPHDSLYPMPYCLSIIVVCFNVHYGVFLWKEELMNRTLRTVIVLSTLCLVACASMQNQAIIEKAASEHDFSYYFSSSHGQTAFNDIDSAYTFLNEAAAKFSQAGAKKKG